jgi:hypothetical protein
MENENCNGGGPVLYAIWEVNITNNEELKFAVKQSTTNIPEQLWDIQKIVNLLF